MRFRTVTVLVEMVLESKKATASWLVLINVRGVEVMPEASDHTFGEVRIDVGK
jgi:hypothetical protein